jgi:hypothetical protein
MCVSHYPILSFITAVFELLPLSLSHGLYSMQYHMSWYLPLPYGFDTLGILTSLGKYYNGIFVRLWIHS